MFVNAVLAGDLGDSNAERALAVVRVTEAASRSAREGWVVELLSAKCNLPGGYCQKSEDKSQGARVWEH